MAQRCDAVFGERLAHGIAFIAAWVIEVFVLFALMLQEGPGGSVLLAVGRVGEGVVALHLTSGAHLLGVAQAAKAGYGLIATAVGLVQHALRAYRLVVIAEALVFIVGLDGAMADQAEGLQPIGDDQLVQLFTVRKAVDEAFFSGKAGDERQVRLTGLNAEFAHLMVHAGA